MRNDVLLTALQQAIQYRSVIATVKTFEEHVSVNATVRTYEENFIKPTYPNYTFSETEIDTIREGIRKIQPSINSINPSRSSKSKESYPGSQFPNSSSITTEYDSNGNKIIWDEAIQYFNVGYNKFTDVDFIKSGRLNELAEQFRKSQAHQNYYRKLHEWPPSLEKVTKETTTKIGREVVAETGEVVVNRIGKEAVKEVGDGAIGYAVKQAGPGPLDAMKAAWDLVDAIIAESNGESGAIMKSLSEQGAKFSMKVAFYGALKLAITQAPKLLGPWGWLVAIAGEIAIELFIELFIEELFEGENGESSQTGKDFDEDANQASETPNVAPLIQVKEDKTIDFTLLNAVLPEYLTVEGGIQLSLS